VSNFIQTCAKDALIRSQRVLLAAGDGDLRGVLERRRVGADREFVEVESVRGADRLMRSLAYGKKRKARWSCKLDRLSRNLAIFATLIEAVSSSWRWTIHTPTS
jgi:hypothetical protein